MIFSSRRFFQKTNENKSTWGIIVVKSNSFVRLKKSFRLCLTFRQAENGWNNNAANFVACVSIRCKPCNLLALAILRPLKCWWCFRQDHYPWCSQSTYLVPVTDYGFPMDPFSNDIPNFWANWADRSNKFWPCESTKKLCFSDLTQI